MTNIFELLNSVQGAANKINDMQKLAVPMLAVKATRAASQSPNDQGLRVLSNILSKMNENGKLFVSKGEFRSLYFKVADSKKSAARDVFADELGLIEQEQTRPLAGANIGTLEIDPYKAARDMTDPLLTNAIGSLWDTEGNPNKSEHVKAFDESFAKQAEVLTNLELGRLGFPPKAVSVFGGTSEFIICDAKYETPKGESHVLVPVELSASGALMPTIFISKFGAVDLKDKNAIREGILHAAGKGFRVDAKQLIKALSLAKEATSLDEFELKILAAQERLNLDAQAKIQESANQYKVSYSSPSIIGQSIDEYKPENAMLRLPQVEGVDKVSSLLNSGKGLAELTFGRDTVNSGRDIIVSKLASFGYSAQVSVSSCTDDSIIYAVGIHSGSGPIGFEVVADVNHGKVTLPTIAAIQDKVFDFNQTSIDNMIQSRASDPKMVAKISPLYDLKPSELLEIIRSAADKQNYMEAEDALNILATGNNEALYNQALAEYFRSLSSSLNKEAHNHSKCSKIVKSSSHVGPVCGHLNLPLDKVCQNKYGECVPKYRESMNDTYEDVLFTTYKLLQ